MNKVDKTKALAVIVGILGLYALWNTIERVGFMVGMAALARANAVQGGGITSTVGAGLSLVNIFSALLVILAWWAIAALAWIVRSESLPQK